MIDPTSQNKIVRSPDERKRLIEAIAAILTVILLLSISRLETRLFQLSETLSRSKEFITTIVYFALINLNVILILLLSFLIFRHIAKLLVERRHGRFGSRLRTKLVISLVLFALAPTVLMFYVTSRYITTSFDDWLSEKVRATMQQTREAGARVYQQDGRRLENLAAIALHRVDFYFPSSSKVPNIPNISGRRLVGFDKLYSVRGVAVFDREGQPIWHNSESLAATSPLALSPAITEILLRFEVSSGLQGTNLIVSSKDRDVVLGSAAIRNPIDGKLLGIVIAEEKFDTQILKSIESILAEFGSLRPGAQLMRLSFNILLIVMTLLIIFCACWLGFHVARGITGPIQVLADATRGIAMGNYAVALPPTTDDETGQLVKAFSRMAGDLEQQNLKIEESRKRLWLTNEELERRRHYMEVVLRNITAGVVSVDAKGKIASINQAAEKLLGVDATDVLSKEVREGLGPELIASFWSPIAEKLATQPTYQGQLEVEVKGETVLLLIKAARMKDEAKQGIGYVVVLDDLREQVMAQRVAAWREVAQRIAHEIKNPLTPIKLNAQRMLRKFHDRFDSSDQEVFVSCIETILAQVDSLRDLVNEFSKFSRLPNIQTRPGSINDIIRDTVNLFALSYPETKFELSGLTAVPILPLDREQMGRVFVNLVTNALAAHDEASGVGVVSFVTEYLPDVNTVRVEVRDNGCGIPAKLRSRVLEPYFSTKDGGNGLGLAIVNQVVSDHGGYLRIFDNEPRGTAVVIELPYKPDGAV
jgi:two-component system, NtrC family, nitrogen regulation sensor histidine kinase NtrY